MKPLSAATSLYRVDHSMESCVRRCYTRFLLRLYYFACAFVLFACVGCVKLLGKVKSHFMNTHDTISIIVIPSHRQFNQNCCILYEVYIVIGKRHLPNVRQNGAEDISEVGRWIKACTHTRTHTHTLCFVAVNLFEPFKAFALRRRRRRRTTSQNNRSIFPFKVAWSDGDGAHALQGAW